MPKACLRHRHYVKHHPRRHHSRGPPCGCDRPSAPVLEIAATHARDVDVEGRFPAEAVLALRDSGLLGLTVLSEAGGLGGGPHELVATVGAVAGVCGSTAMIYLMHVSAVMPVAVAPPPGLPKLLTQLADGSTLGSLALSEAGSRSHFWAPVSKATRAGDTVHLQARKSRVTSAGHADVYVVSTGSPDVEGGVDLFAVPSATPGLEVAGPWQGTGMRGNASSPMTTAQLAKMSIQLASMSAYLGVTAQRLIEPHDDTMLYVLGVKAAANDAALRITDAAMRVCGGAAFSEHLQISLDSPSPALHDRHRGARSWERAMVGIRTAQAPGFRVRLAATLEPERFCELEPFRAFLDELGIARDDQVIRALAHRGVADTGVELTVESLIPEITITADGVYWHPVSADHDDQLVTRELFPLREAIDEVKRRFVAHRSRADAAAQLFPCA